ncbi:MAG: hypothetical protein Q8P05_03835 [Candidatus Diapherotrites archaeon]|nr:hypothetical protein [Candidatus Diapherotrites archaeon]MDZ4256855.1 hypothetical protein [archaeon]
MAKRFTPRQLKAAKLSGTWGVIVGATTLIINAAPSTALIILAIIIPLSLLVPVVIGFITARDDSKNKKVGTGEAVKRTAPIGVVYALVMIAIGLFFTVFNYMVAALVWGDGDILIEGILVVVGTLIIGLPVMAIIGVLGAAIGGAIYSVTKK